MKQYLKVLTLRKFLAWKGEEIEKEKSFTRGNKRRVLKSWNKNITYLEYI